MTKRKTTNIDKESSSFRDPSGYIFYHNGEVYRAVLDSYADQYKLFNSSKLKTALLKSESLLEYVEDSSIKISEDKLHVLIKPTKIPFISYPYEWSFDQLKDAALLTLHIQEQALKHDMILKDASAYNIQFLEGKPIFIDHLSFEKYEKDQPWVAYKQFCQHFLAPLALMAQVDIRLNQLLRTNVDGIPLDLASTLLPFSSYFNPAIVSHIHFHARNQKHFSGDQKNIQKQSKQRLSKLMLLGILDSLKSCIKNLSVTDKNTEWGEYYSFTNYSDKAFEKKKKIISGYLKEVKPTNVWDIGGNTGEFSRLASEKNIFTVCFDIDPEAVQHNYQLVRKKQEKTMLPLLLDLTNQTPSLGWSLEERQSLISRGPADVVMALALIHHLSISNNLPFEMVADFFQKVSKYLIIEFVPKEDSKVKLLLSTRDDIFPNYTEEHFEKAFSRHFKILRKDPIKNDSARIMYLMEKK